MSIRFKYIICAKFVVKELFVRAIFATKRSILVFLLFFLFLPQTSHAQELIDWGVLQDVKFSYILDEANDGYMLKPTFGEKVLALDGKKVSIKGFMIPLDISGDLYAISALTMNACFFCGGGGPETVMELEFAKKPKSFDVDEYIKMTGTLHINQGDLARLSYILKDATWEKTEP